LSEPIDPSDVPEGAEATGGGVEVRAYPMCEAPGCGHLEADHGAASLHDLAPCALCDCATFTLGCRHERAVPAQRVPALSCPDCGAVFRRRR
jgi:hypothetical protein